MNFWWVTQDPSCGVTFTEIRGVLGSLGNIGAFLSIEIGIKINGEKEGNDKSEKKWALIAGA